MRKITCINDDNVSIALGDTFSPYILTNAEGLYEVRSNLYLDDNTAIDGATYQGSVVSKRNIVLTLQDKAKSSHRENRELLYSVFKPASRGTLLYEENGIAREIPYYVESVYCDSEARARPATVSLMCADPFFQDTGDIIVKMAGWDPAFIFPFEIPSEGIEFERRVNERLKTIVNESASENIGMQITIDAIGPVTNPTVEHVQKQEHISIGSSTMPFSMVSGDRLIITTGDSDKHVYFVHGGETTNINHYMTEDSTYLQLQRGQNSIGYSAEDGVANIMVTIAYRYRYLGV